MYKYLLWFPKKRTGWEKLLAPPLDKYRYSPNSLNTWLNIDPTALLGLELER